MTALDQDRQRAKKTRIAFFATALLLIAADQATKAWAREVMPIGGSLGGRPWPGVFEFTLTYNKGIAFGLLNGIGLLVAPIAVLMAGWSMRHSLFNKQEPLIAHIALGMMCAGSMGNLIDRIISGRVTDMFYFRPINFPVFNLADACISVSTFLLGAVYLRQAAADERAKAANSTVVGTDEGPAPTS